MIKARGSFIKLEPERMRLPLRGSADKSLDLLRMTFQGLVMVVVIAPGTSHNRMTTEDFHHGVSAGKKLREGRCVEL